MSVGKRKILLFIGDLFFLYISLFLAFFLRRPQSFNWDFFQKHLLPFSVIYLIWVTIFYIFGFYELERPDMAFYLKAVSAILVGFIFGVLCFYFLPFLKITPKTILILNVLIFAIFLFFWRRLNFSLFSEHFQNKIVILGKGNEVEKLKKEIKEKPFLGYQLVEINTENEDFLNKIQKENVKTIIFTEQVGADEKLVKILYSAIPLGIGFLDFVLAFEQISEKVPISQTSQSWFLENLREERKKIYDKIKRIFDVFFSSLIIILTLPILPIIALAIKIEDGGSVFYLQERIGKNKKVFKLIKFRSMIQNAEKEGPKWAEVEDQRVTKVGKILRRFHLDEIPQMINVLKGNISMVGPRPERPEFVEKLEKEIPYYNLRHIIKPGFTGWAQIKFRYARSVLDSLEKFQYDLYYIKNRSFLLDLKILLKTFQLFLKK